MNKRLSIVLTALALKNSLVCALILATPKASRVSRSRRLGSRSSAVSNPTKDKAPAERKPLIDPATDLTLPGRHVTIVTTAALPWFTGTSVNPLLRAAQLAKKGVRVTLALPWLSPEDQFGQACVFKKGTSFATPKEQEGAMREWLNQQCDVEKLYDRPRSKGAEQLTLSGCEPNDFEVVWYPARYHPRLGCLFFDRQRAVKEWGALDLIECLPEASGCSDVVILEEPEHLNWYHSGGRWCDRFQYVVGVGHTNYFQYTSEDEGGWYKGPGQKFFTSIVLRAYCDKIINLSATLGDSGSPADRTVVCNVHGVRDEFLDIGQTRAQAQGKGAGTGVYFLGKKLWSKGYRELLQLLMSPEVATALKESTSASQGTSGLVIDLYGSGPDEAAIEQAWMVERAEGQVSLRFLPATDHASEELWKYHLFVNPSTSDVLCTATAEALAMGKMVAIARHPSNEFFYSFANCVTFDPLDPKEFAEVLSKAAQATPRPLSEEDKVSLGWAAATERLVEAAATPKLADPGPRSSRQAREALRPSRGLGAGLLYGFHQFLGAGLVGMVLRDLTGTISELAPLVAEVKKDVKDQGPYRGLFGCLGFNPGALEGGLQGLDPALEARKAVAFAVLWLFASSALATPIAVNKLQPNLAPELEARLLASLPPAQADKLLEERKKLSFQVDSMLSGDQLADLKGRLRDQVVEGRLRDQVVEQSTSVFAVLAQRRLDV